MCYYRSPGSPMEQIETFDSRLGLAHLFLGRSTENAGRYALRREKGFSQCCASELKLSPGSRA